MGLPRNRSTFLPFLPKSVLTSNADARRGLAEATIRLWEEIGVYYSDYEAVARLTNMLEHTGTLTSREARRALLQFLHYIYHSTTPQAGVTREAEYIAGMSSLIFDISGSEHRTYKFILNIITFIEDLAVQLAEEVAPGPGVLHEQALELFLGYATESLYADGGNNDWNIYTPERYDAVVNRMINKQATRTFGDSEFNNLSESDRVTIVDAERNTSGSQWVAFFPETAPPTLPWWASQYSAPPGVFLLTEEQFNDWQSKLPNES